MAGRKLFLTALAGLLLSSCADIVPLTGGGEDEIAPRPVDQSPEQGALYFQGNAVEMTFDEYVKLNDPANTVTMNPSAGKLTTEQKNRTVTVSWDQPLQPNTTYILQLNGAVRDLNESNDSIMQIVFSTGASIDSLGLEGRVVNAYSNQAVPQVSVGLYRPGSDPFRTRPVYATRTGSKGEYRFSYLKDSPYELFAFSDRNKDQLPQPDEAIGYVNGPVAVTDSLPVTIPLFAPGPVRKQLKADHVAPGLLVLYNRDSIDPRRATIDGIPVEQVQTVSPDSVLVALPAVTGENFRILYAGDTLRKSIPPGDRRTPLQIRYAGRNTRWRQGDTLLFRVNDRIVSLQQEYMHVTDDKGASAPFGLIRVDGNGWGIVPAAQNDRPFGIHFDKGAVTGASSDSDSATFSYTTLLSADLSNLKLNCPDLTGRWIIELVQNEKTVYSAVKPEGTDFVEFRRIEPGQYGVRCIRDTNGNGRWDPGNYAQRTQAEEVLRYTLTQKLRANWDVEETLKTGP